jgi:hypothetical protein
MSRLNDGILMEPWQVADTPSSKYPDLQSQLFMIRCAAHAMHTAKVVHVVHLELQARH